MKVERRENVMTQALLLIDIQNDYFIGGRMALVGMDKAAANAARLLAHFRNRQQPVFHVQHIAARPGATFFLPDTDGAQIHASVAPLPGEAVVTKHFPNSFRGSALPAQLEKAGIKELVICGAMSHMCVDSTTRAAFDLGFGCAVAEDACATRDLLYHDQTIPAGQVHSAFMAALAFPFAKVAPTAALI
jgi:nicotinamidase-related amidase